MEVPKLRMDKGIKLPVLEKFKPVYNSYTIYIATIEKSEESIEFQLFQWSVASVACGTAFDLIFV